ncbi:UNVERIFIED_CONTAM: citrate lyase subunit beta/citryl-CoA lyase [Williamsia faeni]
MYAAARRSILAVPASTSRMLEKARGLPADEIFLDLEDAVAPGAKAAGRAAVVTALAAPDWAGQARVVRVNDWTTPWTLDDVVTVVRGAGAHLDSILLPKVTSAAQVTALDLLLRQLEINAGLPVGQIGVQAQIENAQGLAAINEIASASDRLRSLVLGPADMMASLGMRGLAVGEQPQGYVRGDAHHHVLMTILVAARAHGLTAIDGPYLKIDDAQGFRAVADASAALGYDGKWVVHPSQIDIANEVFSPRQSDYDTAENLLDAYAHATSAAGGERGAVRFEGEMIDEASRKMAEVIAAKGRAAGMTRTPAADAAAQD